MGSLRRARSGSGGPTGVRRVRGSRPVSALYGTLSVVLLAAAIVMALIVRPPPPPSIAELGPSPQEQIEEARENQAAGSGDGDLATASEEEEQTEASTQEDGPSEAATLPTTSSSPPEVPLARRCFGDPPRQTEDPHSPPCVFEIFEGDNGGKTAQGVTATEIHVVITDCFLDDTLTALEALVGHFNRQYEFYGRRIELDIIEASGQYCNTSGGDSPSESQALANEVVSYEPFASIIPARTVAERELPRRLADAGIHSIQLWVPFHSKWLIDGWTWLVAPPNDVDQRLAGDFVCRALHDRPARHAGTPQLQQRSRKIAVMAMRFYEQELYPDVSSLMSRLARCGANAHKYKLEARDRISRTQRMQQLQNENFTTIIPFGTQEAMGNVFDATPESYKPEWFVLDYEPYEFGESWWDVPEGAKQGKVKNEAFGITARIRVRSTAETPAFWALEDGGGNTPQQFWVVEPFYKKLLLLASGIQGAGPKLTPESFRQALWETVWPNPNPSGPPHWQQRVSLGPGDYVFYDDYALWWWNSDAPSQQSGGGASRTPDGRGSFCYINRGSRFAPGAFPGNADRRFFNAEEPCR